MKVYSLKIRPSKSFLTPWHADTIFGSLCWIIAWREGADALTEFLHNYKNGNPAFVLSDGLPGDLLPAPTYLFTASLKNLSNSTIENYKKAKELKKLLWLRPKEFESVRKGKIDEHQYTIIKPFKTSVTLHSSINRNTGTTGDEGSLFELEEYLLDLQESQAETMTIYLKIQNGYEERVSNLFKELSLMGFGKKKSIGKGSFEIDGELESCDKFENFSEANGFVSLSNFVPAKNDPTKGFYKTFVKYGKLGGEFTYSMNPFKKPLMMLTAGSAFYVSENIRPFYGRMVENISSAKPEVLHYGYAFAVPIKLSEELNEHTD